MKKPKKPPTPITAEAFDAKVEAGEDVTEHLDVARATKFVNVEFPLWMVAELDAEAARLGIPRQAVIKTFVDEGLARRRARDKTGS